MDKCQFCGAKREGCMVIFGCGSYKISGKWHRGNGCYETQIATQQTRIETLEGELAGCREMIVTISGIDKATFSKEVAEHARVCSELAVCRENSTALVTLLRDAMAFHKYWLGANLPFDASMSLEHWTIKTEQKLNEL